jgi:3-hydroxy acid dehydrogenase/malonic semialdehyde reductase
MAVATAMHGASVLVTGASSGFGRAISEAFAAAGSRIILCARRGERLETLAAELHAAHHTESLVVQLDVRDRAAVASTIESLPEPWRAIDVLVNNAGLASGLHTIQEGEIDDWEEMLDTNVKGLLYITRAVLPGMVARSHGHVINIGSVAGRWVYPKGNVYCASKFAVRALTEGMRMDVHGTGIRVTTVDPGLAETEFSLVRFHGDAARASQTYTGMTPLAATDVADAVLWAATRPAHVNVQEIVLYPTEQAHPTMVHRRI